jgi:hypothetical protein
MLDGVVVTLTDLTRELSDNTELFEMSKDDGDEAGLITIESDAAGLPRSSRAWSSAACSTTRPTPELLCRHPGRRRRHRGLRLGQHAAAPVPEVLPSARASRPRWKTRPGRHRRHQGRHHQGRRRIRLWPAAHRDRRAPPGAQEPVRLSGGRHTSFASRVCLPRD